MNMKDKRQVLEAALLDCENSLQEGYNLIDNNMSHKQKYKVLEKINISITILKLMKPTINHE